MMAEMVGKQELPRYQCHKIVQALKIKSIRSGFADGVDYLITPEDDGYPPFGVSLSYVLKNAPQSTVEKMFGGYYVRYDDGYESWSPAKAFEEGYTRI